MVKENWAIIVAANLLGSLWREATWIWLRGSDDGSNHMGLLVCNIK